MIWTILWRIPESVAVSTTGLYVQAPVSGFPIQKAGGGVFVWGGMISTRCTRQMHAGKSSDATCQQTWGINSYRRRH